MLALTFELYWANSYFFGLGLQKDAPDLLEKLIQLPPEKDSQRWVKLLNLADYMMAAYSTPYRVIEKGVHRGLLEAASLFQDTTEGKAVSPFTGLSQMQLLYFVQLVVRDNYGYEFLAPALEKTVESLFDGDEEVQIRAYATFFLCVANIDAGHGDSFDWVLEDFRGYLPLDLRLAIWHEGSELESRNKALKKLRRNIEATLKNSRQARNEAKKLYEHPIARIQQEEASPKELSSE